MLLRPPKKKSSLSQSYGPETLRAFGWWHLVSRLKSGLFVRVSSVADEKRPSCCLKHFFEVLSVLGDHLQHRSQGLLETTQLRKFTEKIVKLHGIPGT